MYFDILGSPSCSNKLMVYDGVITGFSPIMGKLCGDISTFTFQATSCTMSVVLETNTSSSAFKDSRAFSNRYKYYRRHI